MSTGGDYTQTPAYQQAAARHKKKSSKFVARKTPKSGRGPVKDDHNKIVYDPIPKYEAKSATDYRNKAADISVFQD